jgi:DNA-binding transcriptional ArsR family regulator
VSSQRFYGNRPLKLSGEEMSDGSLDRLMRTYASPARSAILYELTRRGECSATDLAEILGQKVNNIYYHLRILEDDGIIAPPRSVVKRNYVEKYYSLNEKFLLSLNVDKKEWKRSQKDLPPEERRQIAMTGLNLIISILRWRVEDYKRMTREEIDELWQKEWVTLSTFTQEQYETLVSRLEKTWLEAIKEFHHAHSKGAKPFTVVMAALAPQPVAP